MLRENTMFQNDNFCANNEKHITTQPTPTEIKTHNPENGAQKDGQPNKCTTD